MPVNIAITETYLSSVFKLDNQSKKITLNTIKQLANNPKSPSLQIHSVDRIRCDSKFRTARVNSDLRIVFAMQGDTYTLLYVDHHDDAYNWCEGKFLAKTNFGAQYVYDEKVMLDNESVQHVNQIDAMYSFDEKPLLDKNEIKEKHLQKLGIPQVHASNLLKLTTEDSFIEYIDIFPSEIQEGLLDLATGLKSFDTVYRELLDNEHDSQDDDKAIYQKDSKRRFYITQSMEELELLMENDDFEKWTIFLHPSQETLVRRNFNGPALVEGGPGTGKTIVGIHRAVYLAENIYKAEDGKRILFCTFSKKLANSISEKLDALLKQRQVKNNIDVVSVDSLIYTALKQERKILPQVNQAELTNLIRKLYYQIKPTGSIEFYEYEYVEIIEKYNIKTLAEYLDCDRSGTGMPLDSKGRMTAWKFIDVIIKEKTKEGIFTFVDRAHQMLLGLDNGTINPVYDSIIIDEAQDLEPVKLKALCRYVKADTNNILILSDANQRIFRLSTWKKDSGINIVGRTYHLFINYRTTKQINDYARYQFINSEMVTSHIKEYKSIVNGIDPIVQSFTSESDQYKYIVSKVKEYLEAGYKGHQICVVSPTKNECEQINSILKFSDIDTTILVGDTFPNINSGVCLCPVSGVKGLEFEVVIIHNYNNIGVGRVQNKSSEAIIINYNKLIECEKYVATTRARNELVVTYIEKVNKNDITIK